MKKRWLIIGLCIILTAAMLFALWCAAQSGKHDADESQTRFFDFADGFKEQNDVEVSSQFYTGNANDKKTFEYELTFQYDTAKVELTFKNEGYKKEEVAIIVTYPQGDNKEESYDFLLSELVMLYARKDLSQDEILSALKIAEKNNSIRVVGSRVIGFFPTNYVYKRQTNLFKNEIEIGFVGRLRETKPKDAHIAAISNGE